MTTESDATDKLQPETDGASTPAEKLAVEAGDGLGEQSHRVTDYYEARRGGMRDRITQENLPAQPAFFDSQSAAASNRQNFKGLDDSHGGGQAAPTDNPVVEAQDVATEQQQSSVAHNREGLQPVEAPLAAAFRAIDNTHDSPPSAHSSALDEMGATDGPHHQQPRFDDQPAPASPEPTPGPSGTGTREPVGEPTHEPVPAHDRDDHLPEPPHGWIASDVPPVSSHGAGHQLPIDDEEHAPPGGTVRPATDGPGSGKEPQARPARDVEANDQSPAAGIKPGSTAPGAADELPLAGQGHPPAIDCQVPTESMHEVKSSGGERTEVTTSSPPVDHPTRTGGPLNKQASDNSAASGAPAVSQSDGASAQQKATADPDLPARVERTDADKSDRQTNERASRIAGPPDARPDAGQANPPKVSEMARGSRLDTVDRIRMASADFADPKARVLVGDVLKRMESGTLKPEQLDSHSRRIFDAVKALSPDRLERLKQMVAGEPQDGLSRPARALESKAHHSKSSADNLKPSDSTFSGQKAPLNRIGDLGQRYRQGSDQGLDREQSKLGFRDLGKLLRQSNKDMAGHSGAGDGTLKPLVARSFDLSTKFSDKNVRERAQTGKEEALVAKLTAAQHAALSTTLERRPKSDRQLTPPDGQAAGSKPDTGVRPTERTGTVGDPHFRAGDSDAAAAVVGESSDDGLEEKTEGKDVLASRDFAGTLECVFFKERRRQYIVQEEDTIESIAAEKLRDDRLAPLILEINADIIPVRHKDGEQIIDLKPLMAIWLPTTADIRYFRGPLAAPAPGEQPQYAPTHATGARSLSPEAELAARFGGSPEDYVVDALQEQRVLSFVQQLDEACRLVRWGKGGAEAPTLESRLEVRHGEQEWVPIVSYEIVGDTAHRHEFTPDGMRNSIGINLAPHEVQEMAESDLSRNWQSYASNFRSRAPLAD